MIGVIIIVILILLFFVLWELRLHKRASILEKHLQRQFFAKHVGKDIPDHQPFTIKSDFDISYKDHFVTNNEKRDFQEYFSPFYQEARKIISTTFIPLGKTISSIQKFIHDYESINSIRTEHNNDIKKKLLQDYSIFFDTCLSYPLDPQQRRSIVTEEDNCLVVSSAGSGKTSSIVGKVKYLVETRQVAPQDILLISYTHKAAEELTFRMNYPGLRGYTFHKLAIDLIAKATGEKPSICDNTDSMLIDIFKQLANQSSFRKDLLQYFVDYQDFSNIIDDKTEQLRLFAEKKKRDLRVLVPDMDGHTIYVRSEQERKICMALAALGINFRYEEPYEHKVADETHSQYKPDFSIYFTKGNQTYRIYLEHFGINEKGLVPSWFAHEKNISYSEANKRYNDGITWKKELHEKFGTILITTSSADFHYSEIKHTIKKLLEKCGVPIAERSDGEILNMILPKDGNRDKELIRLISTFLTLLKSSCKTINEVYLQARKANDVRGAFIIDKIMRPAYNLYAKTLKDRNQIDFTDAIIEATSLCKQLPLVKYKHIIVDEFQDISFDRYLFLKALRESRPMAKLYCVGDDWQSIYRFSGSDISLFNHFSDYFGYTEIHKIETTYRFGQPLVNKSSDFIQKNDSQIGKKVHPHNPNAKTLIEFREYEEKSHAYLIGEICSSIPPDKSIFLLGRYSFDDYYLSKVYKHFREGDRYVYIIGSKKVEFLTVHKSKGLEADYVIILQCNNDIYGFPSQINDDPVLNYVLTHADNYPYAEERRLFYVAITRAKEKTIVLYDKQHPSIFVNEFIKIKSPKNKEDFHKNAGKHWTPSQDKLLLQLKAEGKSIPVIAREMGRSQTAIIMRLGALDK